MYKKLDNQLGTLLIIIKWYAVITGLKALGVLKLKLNFEFCTTNYFYANLHLCTYTAFSHFD